VVTLKLPPLRERGDDIAVLAKFFLSKYAREFNAKAKGFTPSCTVAMREVRVAGQHSRARESTEEGGGAGRTSRC